MDLLEKAKNIELVVFDVDGVMTDGGLFFGDDGQEYKAFHSKDGHGMRMLHEAGIRSAIITGRQSNVVEHRMKDIGVNLLYQGYRDKTPAFDALLEETGFSIEQIAFVGDDVVDLPVMTRVGLAIAVQDSHPYVKQHAHWITPRDGGRGAVRDVCEFLLEARGVLASALESYLYKAG